MGDRVTGLGQTIDEYEMMNGVVPLADAYSSLREREEGAEQLACSMSDLSIEDGMLACNGERISMLGPEEYGKLCGLLNIPTAYLLRLPKEMRRLNIEYWFDALGDKEVSIRHRNGELVEIMDGTDIRVADMFEALLGIMPDAEVFRSWNQVNSTTFDIYDENTGFDTEYDTYFGGIRLVHRKGLNAPDISPIFLNVNSCGIIECSSYLEKLSIKNLSYKDILQVISERFGNCVDSFAPLFHVFESIAQQKVPNPHRRIALYCREHGMPERVRAYALASFDESGLQDADFEALVDLFSSLGYASEIKQSSERKLQQLAGYIIVKAKGEHRCDKCDNKVNED